jgi:hypothetical protein
MSTLKNRIFIERIKAYYKERLAVSFGLCLFVFLLLAFMLVAPTMSSVSQAAASVSLGDRVWHDANSNGEQETSEAGIGGVTVNLYDGTGLNADDLVSSTVTDADGYYLFTRENDGEDYQVQFVLPSGYTFTTQDAVVTDTIDSDADTSSGATAVFTLSAEDTTQDGGLIAPTTCDTGSNDIGGTIYRDYNADGRQASGERAYTGLVITAYDSSNPVAVLATTVSRPDNGLFVFPGLAASAPVRLEFTNLATGLEFGASGTGSDTGVQFINAATCEADLSLNEPQDYCQNAPDLVSTCYVAGDPLDTSGGSPGSRAGDYDATISFSYHNSIGKAGDASFVMPTHLADTKEVGSVWGLAYDKEREIIYQAAFLKRHVGLGPSGLSGIYATSLTGTITTTQFITLTDLGINVGTIGARDLTYAPTQNTRDPNVFDQVGKVGLGDIDISEDGSTLYIINLFDGKLITLDTASKTISSQITVPNQECQNGLIRPFAVKVYKGEVYVGAVCSAENGGTSANLSAHILQLDGGAFVSVLSFDLDEFTRGQVGGSLIKGTWLPWNSTWQNLLTNNDVIYPVPMLSDIEFDVDGSLIFGFMDRTGHTVNFRNFHPTDLSDMREYSVQAAGDVLRACKVGNQFFIEGTAGLCDYNIEGDSKHGDEYYTGLFYQSHYETAIGGLAQLPGSGEIVSTVYDPLGFNTGGIKWLENSDGSLDRAFQLFDSAAAFSGKANGLGDLELLCDPAPLEIGNYVWLDADRNGIQDAGESPLAGVLIGLYDSNGNQLATTTTDSKGHYYFINADDPRLSTVFSDTVPINYGVIPTTTIGLSVNTNNYQIRIDTTQSTLTDYTLTTQDTGSGSNADEHDSDASTSGNNVIVTVNTGTAGQNNHSIDIGFEPPALAVDLASFEASCQAGEAQIRWQTVSELDNLGFNLLRSTSAEGEGQPLNSDLIMSQAPGSGSGALYEWLDGEVEAGTTYYYSLQDINVGGTISPHGPLSATCEENTTAIQLTSLTTSNTKAPIVASFQISFFARKFT